MKVFNIDYETTNHRMHAVVVASNQIQAEKLISKKHDFQKITSVILQNTSEPVIVSDYGWHKSTLL